MIRPIGDKVVIRPTARDERVGSIYIPDTARGVPEQGVVIAVGPGTPLIPVDGEGRGRWHRTVPGVKPGDRVVFVWHKGQAVEHGGERLYVMAEEYILGVLDEN